MCKETDQRRLYKPSSDEDPINPQYYKAGKIEVIDFIESLPHLSFHLANAIKYISRCGLKDPNTKITDLQKAVWYIQRYIDVLKKET